MIDFHPISQVETNARTTYWLDLWDEQLRLYLVHPSGFEFWNIRLALEVLIDDSTKRHPQSKGIREVLGQSIRRAARTHPLFRSGSLLNEVKLLAQDFEKHEQVLSRNRARLLARRVDSEAYSKILVDALFDILDSDKALSERQGEDLEAITSEIIARLFRLGFSVRAIASIPARLFATSLGEGATATTSFPKQYLDVVGSLHDPRSWMPLTELERVAVEGLTLRQRISTLAQYMHATPHRITCFFGIEGITGAVPVTIGSVSFYSPAVKRFLPGGGDTELMGQDPALYPVNAKLDVLALDDGAAREKARAIVEHTLNVMSLGSGPPPPMAIRSNRWAVVDPLNLGLYGFTEPTALTVDNLPSLTKSLSVLHSAVQGLHAPPQLIGGDSDDSGLIYELSTSLHWLRRAQEATRPEDSLLFHWLAFEKLFDDPSRHEPLIADAINTFSVIELLYPVVDAYIDAHLIRQITRNYIDSFWDGGMRQGFAPRFGPNAYQTLVSGAADDDELLRRLREVDAATAPERFMSQVAMHIKIVDDYREASTFLKGLIAGSRQHIRVIYWLRNRLVHGGDFGFAALSYYSQILDYGTRALLTIATDTRNWRDQPRHPVDILLSFYSDAVGMMRDLDAGLGTLDQCLVARPSLHPFRPEPAEEPRTGSS